MWRLVAGLAAVGGLGGLVIHASRAPTVTADALSPLTTVASLGKEGGTDDALFGLVADIAVDSGGRAYVLDAHLSRVLLFASDGRPLGHLGREGSGPGELRFPAALGVDAEERVYVLDRGNARVAIYEKETVAGVLPLDFGGEDLCFADGRLYVLGERGGYLIHELEPRTGAVLRSFAPDPAARDPLLRGSRVSGYLGCGSSDELVFLPLLLPEVRRYSIASGALIASDPIPGYQAVRIRREARSAVFEAPKGGRHHVGASVLRYDGGWLFQIGFLSVGARTQHEVEELHSYVLAGDAGPRLASRALPRLMAVRDEQILAGVSEPFPQVQVLGPVPGKPRQ